MQNEIPPEKDLELLAETLPYFLANAVFDLSRFLHGLTPEFQEHHRKQALFFLRIYKKAPHQFFIHPQQAFLVEYATTTYPNVIFRLLHRIIMENKNPMATVNNINKLIEVLENVRPNKS